MQNRSFNYKIALTVIRVLCVVLMSMALFSKIQLKQVPSVVDDEYTEMCRPSVSDHRDNLVSITAVIMIMIAILLTMIFSFIYREVH